MANQAGDLIWRCGQLEAALANLPIGVIVFDADQKLILANTAYLQTYDLPPGSLRSGISFRDMLQARKDAGSFEGDPDERAAVFADLLRSGASDLRHVIENHGGQSIEINARRLAGGGWMSTHENVTKRRQAEFERDRSSEFLGFVIDNIPVGLWVKDSEGRYLLTNKQLDKLFGRESNSLLGKTVHDYFPPEVADRLAARDAEAMQSDGRMTQQPTRMLTNKDEVRWVQSRRRPIRGADGAQYLICVIEDVTERRQKDEQIARMANYDQLTDLPNRSLFRAMVDSALAAARPDDALAVLYLDLDHFKTANDSLGHAVGDQLLAVVASRLRQCVRRSDVVARLGGDEFAVILRPRADEPLDAATAARRILARLRDPFELDDHRLSIDVSIGIALAPADGHHAEELLQNADLALYAAKGAGRGTYRFYEPELRARVVARQWLEQDLRAALANHEFVLHYQPILDLRSNCIVSVEALLRWRHPSKGLVGPAEFVGVAEETRLILPIGEWVLSQACRDASLLPDHVRVSVNFSQAQFNSKDLVSRISGAVREAGLRPDQLEIEITESHLIEDHDTAYRRIVRLHEMGFRIAIDDFGTGYSSLQHLASYPFDKLKIDKGFIDQIARGGSGRKISESMISLGIALGMAVTAEGVETEEQLSLLRRLGCTEAQGYIICEPRAIEDVAEMIEAGPQPLTATG